MTLHAITPFMAPREHSPHNKVHSSFLTFRSPTHLVLTLHIHMRTSPKKMPGISKNDTAPKTLHPPPKSSPLSSSKFLPSSPTRNLFKTIVTVTVGPKRQPFYVHLESLCAVSPFFAAAFNKTYNFAESTSATLNLPECRPDDFEYFVQWLYTHTLNHEELVGGHPAYFRLLRLYILADAIRITKLKNDVIDAIAALADSSNSVPTAEDTRTIYGEISETSLLRKLVVDLFLWKKTEGLIETHLDSWYVRFLSLVRCLRFVESQALTTSSYGNRDERFLRELIVKLKRRQPGDKAYPWRSGLDRCKLYHEHDKWAECEWYVVNGLVRPPKYEDTILIVG